MQDPIFLFREVLTPDYLPDHLLHRENELKAISSIIDEALHNRIGNIFIHGPPGTGKTSSIKHIFKKIEEETNALPVYLSCFGTDTRMAAICVIFEEYFKRVKRTKRMPSRRGVSYDELFKPLYSELKNEKTKLIVCFDEIDHLLSRGSKILYDLSRLNERSLSCQIIAISNDEFAFGNIDPRIRSSMNPLEHVPFRPYNFEQMKEIIKVRVEAAFQPDVVDKEAIDFLARYTTAKEGDVRIARDALLRAGELAKKNRDERITVEHIKAVVGGSRFAKAQTILSKLSRHERFILELIPEKGVDLPQFFRFYQSQYPDSVTDRMLRKYLEKFAKLDLIKMKGKGIGGAYWITLNVPKKVLFEIS